jgi:hypothetical protein
LSGEEEENAAEDDKDQTISSSSEAESLAHLALEVRKGMSVDDDREVVMTVMKRGVLAQTIVRARYLL